MPEETEPVADLSPTTTENTAPAPRSAADPATIGDLNAMGQAIALDLGNLGDRHQQLAEAFVAFAKAVQKALKDAGHSISDG